MRKAIVLEFVSLDGVIPAPGGPEEDSSGGFAYGEWISPHSDPVNQHLFLCAEGGGTVGYSKMATYRN